MGGWFINESGLYSLILSSKLPQAKSFKRWVTSEVLPQIYKTDGYIPLSEYETEEEFLARALIIAQNTLKKKDEIVKSQQKRIEVKDCKLFENDFMKLMKEWEYTIQK